jgi:hypothetical protein
VARLHRTCSSCGQFIPPGVSGLRNRTRRFASSSILIHPHGNASLQILPQSSSVLRAPSHAIAFPVGPPCRSPIEAESGTRRTRPSPARRSSPAFARPTSIRRQRADDRGQSPGRSSRRSEQFRIPGSGGCCPNRRPGTSRRHRGPRVHGGRDQSATAGRR